MTYREQFDSALRCKTKEEADAWMREEVARYGREFGQSEDEARKVILCNLGYMAGYYGPETMHKIHELFGAVHPVFGLKRPTAKEALMAGQQAAQREGR